MADDFFGLEIKTRTRESVWLADPCVDWEATPKEAQERYYKDADPRHLTMHPQDSAAPRKPLRIVMRPLTAEERSKIESLSVALEDGAPVLLWSYRYLLAFAIGCDLPGLADKDPIPGVPSKWEDLHGMRRLARGLVDAVTLRYGDAFAAFYGGHVWAGSILRNDDFLASSPASTAPSSASAGTSPIGG